MKKLLSVVWHCWLGDRKGIRTVKSWVLVCWWWRFDWIFARLIAPVVTTSSIIRLRNDLYCVEWDVKLNYTIPYLRYSPCYVTVTLMTFDKQSDTVEWLSNRSWIVVVTTTWHITWTFKQLFTVLRWLLYTDLPEVQFNSSIMKNKIT